jgi:hypothetical protein
MNTIAFARANGMRNHFFFFFFPIGSKRLIDFGIECTRTLVGRYRKLPFINSKDKKLQKHSERAAINTPIQVRKFSNK